MREAIMQELIEKECYQLGIKDNLKRKQKVSERERKHIHNIENFKEPSEYYDEILNALNANTDNTTKYTKKDLYTTTVNEMFGILYKRHWKEYGNNFQSSDCDSSNSLSDDSDSETLQDVIKTDGSNDVFIDDHTYCRSFFLDAGNVVEQTKLYNLTWLGRLSLAMKHRSGQPIDEALNELVWEDGKISLEKTNEKYSLDDLQKEDIDCQKAIYNILCRKLEKKTNHPSEDLEFNPNLPISEFKEKLANELVVYISLYCEERNEIILEGDKKMLEQAIDTAMNNLAIFQESLEYFREIRPDLFSGKNASFILENLSSSIPLEMIHVLFKQFSSKGIKCDSNERFSSHCLKFFSASDTQQIIDLYNNTWFGLFCLALKYENKQSIDEKSKNFLFKTLKDLAPETGKISFEEASEKFLGTDAPHKDLYFSSLLFSNLCEKIEKKTLSPNCVNHCLIAAGLSISATSGALLMLTSTSLTNVAICSSIMGILVGVSKYNWDTYKVVSYNINHHPFKDIWSGSQAPADGGMRVE